MAGSATSGLRFSGRGRRPFRRLACRSPLRLGETSSRISFRRESVQALIWKELTPELLTSAILPRWWDVSPMELHAIALYQRTGEELLTASAKDEALRNKVDEHSVGSVASAAIKASREATCAQVAYRKYCLK